MPTMQAVIFDLDGTLLDTLTDLRESTNFALMRAGFPPRTTQEVRCFVGNGIARLIRLALPADAPQEVFSSVYADMTAHYARHCEDNTKPYDGILPLLQILKKKNYRLAVVSNKVDDAVKKLCSRYFDGFFDAAIGERAGVRRKPAPDSVFAALEELRVSPAAAVYVGDSEVDVQTAVHAGLPCLSVLWGFRTPEELLATGATHPIAKPEDILTWLENNK